MSLRERERTDGFPIFRCGDAISIELDVDPSFDRAEYRFVWSVSNISGGQNVTGPKYMLQLAHRSVCARLTNAWRVISNKAWHIRDDYDDQVEDGRLDPRANSKAAGEEATKPTALS
jgi:hypothetical protein